jgi:adenylate cyclase
MRTPRRALLVGMLLTALVLAWVPTPERALLSRLDRSALDAAWYTLRASGPRETQLDVVLIGIDDTSLAELPYPLALWHRHLAELFAALATSQPRVVGVDMVLPERSYDFVVPGLDIELFRALRNLRAAAPIVLARRVDSTGRLHPIHAPFLLAAGGAPAVGIDQVFLDPDLTVRRFDEAAISIGDAQPSFAGQIARALGIEVTAGLIDYSLGPLIRYVPMHQVLAWHREGDEERLRQAFAGKVVLVGTVTHAEDRLALPVRLAAFDSTDSFLRPRQPGVLVHAQVLRTLGSAHMVTPLSPAITVPFLLICAIPLLKLKVSLSRLTLLAAIMVVGLVTLSVYGLRLGLWFGPSLPVLVVALALATRGGEALWERLRLKASLAGQVSPAVLRSILEGDGDHRATAKRDVCILFSDIRGFTTISESMPAEAMTAQLQRYFDAMVEAVHRHDGVLDKFMGDGMMVLFGAPNTLANPCKAAVDCAEDMRSALVLLNEQFAQEGKPRLQIGIGINFGRVITGWIGSTRRNNYSAVGDAVNVAARIEGLTKEAGYDLLISAAVMTELQRHGTPTDARPLGAHAIKGHTPVEVFGL